MKKKVALIYGGEGYEHDVSVAGANNLYDLIDKDLYDVIKVFIDKDGCWYVQENGESEEIPCFPARLNKVSGLISRTNVIPVDCAVPCLHGDFGEDGTVEGLLTAAHIPYVGQRVAASAICSDKALTKLAAEHLGIPTSEWVLADGVAADEARRIAEDRIGYPMFIKPVSLGSSYGAHPIISKEDFDGAYADAKKHSDRLIIEKLIAVDYELECALLNCGRQIIIPGGRVLSNGRFYDNKSKYDPDASPRTEAQTGRDPISEGLAAKYSAMLAELIGIDYLSRFDFFVTPDKKLYFNEINTFPGMTATSLYPQLTEVAGLNRGEFINLLIEKACADDRGI